VLPALRAHFALLGRHQIFRDRCFFQEVRRRVASWKDRMYGYLRPYEHSIALMFCAANPGFREKTIYGADREFGRMARSSSAGRNVGRVCTNGAATARGCGAVGQATLPCFASGLYRQLFAGRRLLFRLDLCAESLKPLLAEVVSELLVVRCSSHSSPAGK
jgi:hypothetical protein